MAGTEPPAVPSMNRAPLITPARAVRALVAVALVAALPGAAAAAQRQAAVPPSTVTAARTTTVQPQVVAPATGRLQAQGAGAISLEGSMVAFGLIKGTASVLVQDLAGDSKVTVGGRQRRIGRTGTLRLGSATGRFYIQGTRIRVRISGPVLVASAAGRGRFLLEGAGSYSVNGGDKQDWPDPPEPIELLPAAETPPAG